ncbi:MAG: glycosyltransferase [Anaeroplasmataceae bacterium]
MINLLFAGNEKVFDGVLTCLLSIVKRAENQKDLNVTILSMDQSHLNKDFTLISDEQINFLTDVLKQHNPNNKVTKIDVTDLYVEHFHGCPNEQTYVTPYALLRLFADLVPELPDKVLYLDIDTMFNKDISLLYDIDVSDYEYGAARDYYARVFIKPNYINSGVLLMNLKKIKETGLLKKARDLLKVKKLIFVDQSAIIRSTTKRKLLPQRCNDQKFLHKNTIIRHFSKRLFWLPYPHTGNIKQWHVKEVKKVFKYNQFDDIYEDYFKLKEQYKNLK